MSSVPVWDELNPFPWYQFMRQSDPVSFASNHNNWNVFCYDDVRRVLSDYECFSSNMHQGHDPNYPISASLISTDPPRHRQLRTLVTQAFTPRAVEELAPRIREICEELLQKGIRDGEMDVVQDFSYPLPVIVIAELLGIPAKDRDQFKRWSDAVVTGVHEMEQDPSGELTPTNPQKEMAHYFMEMIERRKREPSADLITGLLNASEDGQTLSTVELLGFCILLLVAGNETTTNLITNTMLCLDEHPGTAEYLSAHMDAIPNAIEEVLRFRSPVQSMFRVAIKETQLKGKTILPGQSITAWIGSANHDEGHFERAEEFDIHRTENRHIAFGHGIHFCLGAPLARLEAKIAMETLLTSLPHFKRKSNHPLSPIGSSIVYGVKSLPIECHA